MSNKLEATFHGATPSLAFKVVRRLDADTEIIVGYFSGYDNAKAWVETAITCSVNAEYEIVPRT